MTRKEEIKNLIAGYMHRAKEHAAKYGDDDALYNIGLWYRYATKPNEKTALHIIINHFQGKGITAPTFPTLPKLETI